MSSHGDGEVAAFVSTYCVLGVSDNTLGAVADCEATACSAARVLKASRQATPLLNVFEHLTAFKKRLFEVGIESTYIVESSCHQPV